MSEGNDASLKHFSYNAVSSIPQNAIKRVREGRLNNGVYTIFHPVNIIYLHCHETHCNFLREYQTVMPAMLITRHMYEQ